MQSREIKDRIASALRECGVAPAALVFERVDDLTWDEPTLFGIPVLHAAGIGGIVETCPPCPFTPAWATESEALGTRRKRFYEGWEKEEP